MLLVLQMHKGFFRLSGPRCYEIMHFRMKSICCYFTPSACFNSRYLFSGRYCPCSVTRALLGSLWLASAATEGGGVSDLLASVLWWRGTQRIWTVAARVHPPVGSNQKTRIRLVVLAASFLTVSED